MMSTLAEIEAALPQLTAAELAEVERLAKAARVDKETSLAGITQAPQSGARRKVGAVTSAPVRYSPDCFAPLTDEELKDWGL